MSTETSQLQQSPDPQPVKVFKLDDCTWWAGYSLQQCIDQARAEDGLDCYEYAEEDGYELTSDQMRRLPYVDQDLGVWSTFAAELQRRIDAGEQFPQLFACTEY